MLAILDWGLGHASRCVPLINQWQKEGKEVYVVCSGSSLTFLKAECPTINFLEWKGYEVRYPTSSMVLNMVWQGLRIARVVKGEHRQMKKWVQEIQPDLIVSDGRFGCSHPEVKSIWMAHQLQIQHPFQVFATLVNFLYHRFISKSFQEIWIPDYEGKKALAGRLSKPISGIPYQFLGPLSRYSRLNSEKKNSVQKKYVWLALLSGPEPQRSFLEKELLQLFEKRTEPCLLVRGVAGNSTFKSINDHLQIVDCLYGDQLFAHVMAADRLICRSGYSTLMDLYYWNKLAILIPTPGQTEQIYLAQYWQKKGWAEWQEQGRLEI